MSWADGLHDLVFALVPAWQIRLTPQLVLTTVGVSGLIHFEYRTWRRHR